MADIAQEHELLPNRNDDNFKSLSGINSESSETDTCRDRGLQDNLKDSISDEDAPRKRILRRVKRFSDSDSDSCSSREKTQNGELPALENTSGADKSILQSDDSEYDANIAKSISHKSRIQKRGTISDSELSECEEAVKSQHHHTKNKRNGVLDIFDSKEPTNSDDEVKQKSGNESDNAVKNVEQQLRMKNKRHKLKDKFKSLLKTKHKELSLTNDEVNEKSFQVQDISSESEEDMASIEKIKQKIKERISFKPSICDPDTSDEESNQQKSIYKQKKERKTKLTSPKPQRMSAKQAMENMQKIKSESNRMLREKEVSLPYHRPKVLSLKDIMNRRKLAVSSEGKALPIKMNKDQLKQYALMLEERQKEMMELCKSESEEEEANDSNEIKDTIEEPEKDIENATEHVEEAVKNTTENPAAVFKDTVDPPKKVSIENATEDQALTSSTKQQNINNEEQELDSTENIENDLSNDVLAVLDTEQNQEEHDSETSMKLVFNDSANSMIDENVTTDVEKNVLSAVNYNTVDSKSNVEETQISHCEVVSKHEDILKNNSERDSQLISLHLDTEDTEPSKINDIINISATESIDNSVVNNNTISDDQDVAENKACIDVHVKNKNNFKDGTILNNDNSVENEVMEVENEFSDDDINMEDIDNIIENAEIIKDIEDKVNSQFLIRDKPLNLNPKLTGAPGMVIDLDDSDTVPRKSGVELLKERFTYFSRLKTPEEIERERENRIQPGTQLKKLKQEFEEQIAEQRSLEWAKRLEEEKKEQRELKELRGEDSEEDDIDKIEAAIEEKDEIKDASEESDGGEEEPIENDIEIKDKPRAKNAMVDDEAEESDCDENEDKGEDEVEQNDDDANDVVGDDDDIEGGDGESESDESDESSESEEEQTVTKKGRIFKAFEDSDEEDAKESKQLEAEIKESKGMSETKSDSSVGNILASQIASQDDDLQLAQRPKSSSDDLFTSQESIFLAPNAKEHAKDLEESDDAFTQTFSILDSSKQQTVDIELNSSGKTIAVDATQTLDINNIDDALCPITDSQNLPLPSQIPTTQLSQSQPIGEDILALCTGQFYNNQFLSQVENAPLGNSQNYDAFDNYQSQDSQEDATQANTDMESENQNISNRNPKDTEEHEEYVVTENNKPSKNNINYLTDPIDPNETEDLITLNSSKDIKIQRDKAVDDNLKSILDELADPEFDVPKPNKYFVDNNVQGDRVHTEVQMKRKLVIDSDDDTNEGDTNVLKKRKKLKKKKPEKRALQISDDEEEQSDLEEIAEYETDIEEDNIDRLVEYDSEENEIEVKPKNPKKKRKMAEFFENEAELTSEDEWVGSGDEDEAGLDRMEREEGDDDTFHQGTLQRELGQIHMRDVLDQDKREVRLIQELLFEDGDLGGGGRQRKFRWNNLGDEETGTVPDEFADTQEEEFESEEQWRKQRHEREMFLRQLQNKDDPGESLNVSVNRSTIIKANLLSKTMSSLLMDVNNSISEKAENPAVEKKTAKDIPSPKKPFALLQQQSYQGSLLSRGRGALARLAALATPLAADDTKLGTIGPNSRRNFVFAALTPEHKEQKVTKRRAESNPSTPKLVKKIRTEENNTKSSLLDHFKL